MTPYEVFFFSSGAVEEGWKAKDLAQSRANVLVGFPLGGLLSLAIAGCAAVVLLPQLIAVTSLSQVMLPVAVAGGKLLLAGSSSGSSRRPSAPLWRPRCRPGTRSRSSSAGPGASSGRRRRRRASIC